MFWLRRLSLHPEARPSNQHNKQNRPDPWSLFCPHFPGWSPKWRS